jgi:hypothetical protein
MENSREFRSNEEKAMETKFINSLSKRNIVLDLGCGNVDT